MQRIVMNRALLTELGRCERSFVMSLFHHALSNDSLSQHGNEQAKSANKESQLSILMSKEEIKTLAATVGSVETVECDTPDIFDKVAKTKEILGKGKPCVIVDGALESDWLISSFSLLSVREDLKWDVYHLTTRGFMKGATKQKDKALEAALSDGAPLLKVLSDGYSEKVAQFFVVGMDGRYMTPYPDPVTGKITYEEVDALYQLDFDLTGASVQDYLGDFDFGNKVRKIQEALRDDPFYIPSVDMGSQCNRPYVCPFKTYCESKKDPDSVYFHMPSNDAKKLIDAGYHLMKDLLNLSYSNPALTAIPFKDNPEKFFDISEIGLRELREYETTIQGR